MKKYLSFLCALLVLTSFASCGDSSSSSDSSEASESSISEEATEAKDFTVLDSDWECDYLKIGTCSNWEGESKTSDDNFSVYWNWKDENSYHRISLYLDESMSGKMSQSDLQELYSYMIADYQDVNSPDYDENYKDVEILDSFTENGQAYIIVGPQNDGTCNIHFSTDIVQGSFYYFNDDEEIVRDMIETIEFY